MEIAGTRYSKGSIVVHSLDQFDIPNFCSLIEFLVTPHNEILFVCTALVTTCYDHHYHAYQITYTDEIIVLHHENLHDYHPLTVVTPVGCSNTFVSLKYHLFNYRDE